jgi:hypothetical protein
VASEQVEDFTAVVAISVEVISAGATLAVITVGAEAVTVGVVAVHILAGIAAVGTADTPIGGGVIPTVTALLATSVSSAFRSYVFLIAVKTIKYYSRWRSQDSVSSEL